MDIQQRLCISSSPEYNLIACLYDPAIFYIALYFFMSSAVIFIPWIIYVFYRSGFQIDKVGNIMLIMTFIQQVIILNFSFIGLGIIKIQNSNNDGIILVFLISVLVVIFIKIIYFYLSLKRVRIWIISKTPQELIKNLDRFKKQRLALFAVLIALSLFIIIAQSIISRKKNDFEIQL